MEDDSLVGKWVAIYPQIERDYLTRTQVLKVIKETKKQVLAKESNGQFSHTHTINKARVMCVVPDSDIDQIREDAKNIGNELRAKQKSLIAEYHAKMKGIVGENY